MKKKLLSFIIMFFLAVSIVLTGCTEQGLTGGPDPEANVISNGGMAVIKGDYLYYVNGYIDETTLGRNDNKAGTIEKSGIYRTQLDVNGDIQKDEDGFLVKTERVVSKVVGFSNGGFYIIDNYIYYATPYMKLSSDGVLQSNRVEFHRVKLEGTGDKVVYNTSKNEDNLDWTLYKIENTVYLVTYVDGKIMSVNTETNSVVGTVDSSTSYIFLKETDYSATDTRTAPSQTHIFFTRSLSRLGFSGNTMCTFNIATGEIQVLADYENDTYTIIAINRDTLYYTKKSSVGGDDAKALLYRRNISESYSIGTERQLSDVAYNSYTLVATGNDRFLVSNSSGIYLIENGASRRLVLGGEHTVLAVYGDYGYYSEENALIRFAILGDTSSDTVTAEDKAYTITNEKYIDYDNRRVYVYANYTAANGNGNDYLNYIDLDTMESRFVGQFESNDVPAKPEQDENYGEEGYEDIEYKPHID